MSWLLSATGPSGKGKHIPWIPSPWTKLEDAGNERTKSALCILKSTQTTSITQKSQPLTPADRELGPWLDPPLITCQSKSKTSATNFYHCLTYQADYRGTCSGLCSMLHGPKHPYIGHANGWGANGKKKRKC